MTRLTCFLAVTLASLALGAAPPVAAQAVIITDPQAGREVAEKLCSACHVVSDRQQRAADMAPTFEEIAERSREAAEALAARLMQSPHPQMPEPMLTNQQRGDVAAYILSLKPR